MLLEARVKSNFVVMDTRNTCFDASRFEHANVGQLQTTHPIGMSSRPVLSSSRPAAAAPTTRSALLVTTVTLGMVIATRAVAIGPALRDGFDGPPLKWRQLATEFPLRIQAHDHVADRDRAGSSAEQVRVSLAGGSSVQFAYRIGRAPVLSELRATLWVKSNRPGVQLAAQVVLPRSLHPTTGAPLTVLIRAGRYEAVGMWQQLELSDLPTKVKRQSRVLRLDLKAGVDHRQAFVTDVVLIVPGGPGGTIVRTDDLVVDGVLMKGDPVVPLAGQHAGNAVAENDIAGVSQAGTERTLPAGDLPSTSLTPHVRMHGSVLEIDGRPFFPRAIQHRGESIQSLAELGFNTVLLSRPPTAAEVLEADQHDVWYVCIPPSAEQLATGRAGGAAELDRVLAWLLPDDEAHFAPGQLRHRVESIRQWDAQRNRPLVSRPGVAPQVSGRLVDVALLGRYMPGLRAELARHTQWVQQQASLTGPGAPRWMQIFIAPENATASVVENQARTVGIDERLLVLLARVAVTNHCTGLVVRQPDSLENDHPITRRRANALAFMNLQLALIEPWLTGGKVIGHATSTHPGVSAVVMQVERARLVVPLEWALLQTSADQTPQALPTLVVPGVPESNQVFLLTPGGLTPLAKKRVAGGLRITFDPAAEGFVLLTEDPGAIAALRRQTEQLAGRAAQIQNELAVARLAAASRWKPPASEEDPAARQRQQLLAQAATLAGQSSVSLAQRRAAQTIAQATAACRLIDQLVEQLVDSERGDLELHNCGVTPALDTIADYLQLRRAVAGGRFGANQLYGGDFEDLHRLMQFGWRHVRHEMRDVHSHVELTAQRPYHGRYCLVLSAWPADPEAPPAALSDAPLEIISPPVQVAPSQIVEVSGYVRIDRPIVGHADGLEIRDLLAGPGDSITVQQTDGWQPFRLIRQVSAAGELHLEVALHGLGTARLDALMVRAVEAADGRPSTPAELRPLAPNVPQPAAQAQRVGPLFDEPQLR